MNFRIPIYCKLFVALFFAFSFLALVAFSQPPTEKGYLVVLKKENTKPYPASVDLVDSLLIVRSAQKVDSLPLHSFVEILQLGSKRFFYFTNGTKNNDFALWICKRKEAKGFVSKLSSAYTTFTPHKNKVNGLLATLRAVSFAICPFCDALLEDGKKYTPHDMRKKCKCSI